MKEILFCDRNPFPQTLKIGVNGDADAERIRFGLPEIDQRQQSYIFMELPAEDGTRSDVMQLTDNELIVTREMAARSGTVVAYIEIHSEDGAVIWHSGTFKLLVKAVGDIAEEIDQEYPTAIQQALEQTAVDRAAAEKAVQDVVDSVQTILDAAEKVVGIDEIAAEIDANREAAERAAAEAEESEVMSKTYADRAQMGAATSGWFSLVPGDDGWLYYVKSENAPNDLRFEDDGNGRLVAVYVD